MARFLMSVVALFVFVSCGVFSEMVTVPRVRDVEISPGEWLEVSQEHSIHGSDLDPFASDPHNLSPSEAIEQLSAEESGISSGEGTGESTRLTCQWNGRLVEWTGVEIPITLREHDGRLFMIGFNRESFGKTRFEYFELNSEGTGFSSIDPKKFPGSIATQNMWLSPDTRYLRVGETRVDKWEMLRTLDTENPYFRQSFTAYLWYQIETGVERYEMPRLIDEDFIRGYVQKHKPIALPTIMRE